MGVQRPHGMSLIFFCMLLIPRNQKCVGVQRPHDFPTDLYRRFYGGEMTIGVHYSCRPARGRNKKKLSGLNFRLVRSIIIMEYTVSAHGFSPQLRYKKPLINNKIKGKQI